LGHNFFVFHLFTMDELSNKIQALIPIWKHGMNWGNRHVKVAFTQIDIRVPMQKKSQTLELISRAHLERWHHALPFQWKQYNVTILLALWHIDYEYSCSQMNNDYITIML
jgi:hypothetical protein